MTAGNEPTLNVQPFIMSTCNLGICPQNTRNSWILDPTAIKAQEKGRTHPRGFEANHTSSIALKPPSTPFNHLPLSSNSSPKPPFSLPLFASFALCTAPFLRASNGPRSASRSATARLFSGSTRLRFAIWRSRSASSCSFLDSSESVGCNGRFSDGFDDFGCCEARNVAMVVSRCEISSGRAAS